jgi:hypothetical protein
MKQALFKFVSFDVHKDFIRMISEETNRIKDLAQAQMRQPNDNFIGRISTATSLQSRAPAFEFLLRSAHCSESIRRERYEDVQSRSS